VCTERLHAAASALLAYSSQVASCKLLLTFSSSWHMAGPWLLGSLRLARSPAWANVHAAHSCLSFLEHTMRL
jgi:hypothetical protein